LNFGQNPKLKHYKTQYNVILNNLKKKTTTRRLVTIYCLLLFLAQKAVRVAIFQGHLMLHISTKFDNI
jgi:hypothetical protein